MKPYSSILPSLLLLFAGIAHATDPRPADPAAIEAQPAVPDETKIAPIMMTTGAEGGGYWGLGTRMAKAITTWTDCCSALMTNSTTIKRPC